MLGLRAVRWRESAPGSGAWDAPDDLGGGPLAPVLGSATLPDGRHLLFGLRFSAIGGHGADNEREIVALEQRSPGGPFRAWQGLGNPVHGHDGGRRIGVPVAVAAPDGRVHLFVRNAEKGVSTRVRDTAGSVERVAGHGRWRDPGRAECRGGRRGCVHVYAAGRFAVHHWTQDAPGEALTARTQISGVPVPGDGPAALPGADGTVELFYRAAAKAALTTVRTGETADETGIDGYGRLTGGRAGLDGYGPVAAAGSPGAPVLLGRTASGLLQLRTPRGHFVRRRGPVALDGACPARREGRTADGGGDGPGRPALDLAPLNGAPRTSRRAPVHRSRGGPGPFSVLCAEQPGQTVR